MKRIGIWMDNEKAHLVTLGDINGDDSFETIESGVEFFNLKSSGQARTKWGGPQEVVHERTYLEREKHQMKSYFSKLAGKLQSANQIVVFGPADVGEHFRKELLINHKPIAEKIKKVQKEDSMTENQVRTLVRDFFKTSD